jgi:hypothetical protein
MKTTLINGVHRKLTPLLMKPELVRQTLDGKKTQTRRLNGLDVINESPDDWILANELQECEGSLGFWFFNKHEEDLAYFIKLPYGKSGDIIWVRENFKYGQPFGPESLRYLYNDGNYSSSDIIDHYKINDYDKMRPCIHMPFNACRLFLEIIVSYPQRLGEITPEDAIAEGIHTLLMSSQQLIEMGQRYMDYMEKNDRVFVDGHSKPEYSFFSLWESINGEESLLLNPWVWRVEFKVIDKPEIL